MSGCEVALCFVCLWGAAFCVSLTPGWGVTVIISVTVFNRDVFRPGSFHGPFPKRCGGVKVGWKTF